MIDFRYHLVSIIAVFFALAAGIVLGAGPLGDQVDDDLTGQLSAMREENQNLREQVDTYQTTSAAQEEFVNAVTPALVSGELECESVGIIALPGAEEGTVEAVRDALERAGAAAELRVQIEPAWSDPDSEAVLDSLASQLVSSGTELPEDADGYTRGATVLATALLAQPADDGTGSTGQTVETATVDAFAEAGLLALEQNAAAAPTLAVMVAGEVSGEDAEERTDRLVELITVMDREGGGTVAAGPPITAEDDGLIAAIRSEDSAAEAVSTVDSTGSQSGAVSIVFALLQQNAGSVGHYGTIGDVDGVIPPVPERTTSGEDEQSEGEPTTEPTDGTGEGTEGEADAEGEADGAAEGADDAAADAEDDNAGEQE